MSTLLLASPVLVVFVMWLLRKVHHPGLGRRKEPLQKVICSSSVEESEGWKSLSCVCRGRGEFVLV